MKHRDSFENRRLLLIESDGYCRYFLTEIMELDLALLTTCALDDGAKAYEMVLAEDFDVILLSIDAWRQKDLLPVRELSDINNQTQIIVISGNPSADLAMAAVKLGAADYLVRPFNNAERVRKAFADAFRKRDETTQSSELDRREAKLFGLLGRNPKIDQLRQLIRQVAPLDVSVLITGESGTGKELVAQAIHAQNARREGPFVAVNCGALPEGLVESLFFGHERGAFTGADASREGYVELANGGTLFLDEVGELSPKAQPVLLRFLQQREFSRVGGDSVRTSDVRIIAATNRNLEKFVAGGSFRTDLFYRLGVVTMQTPPLRERPEDISDLANYFAKRFCLRNHLPLKRFTQGSLQILEQYQWPGNVREFENVIEGTLATMPADRQSISVRDIVRYAERVRPTPAETARDRATEMANLQYREAAERFERSYLTQLLEQYDNNVAEAARAAGLHSVTLHRKLKKLREG